jgi:hypothetical protein
MVKKTWKRSLRGFFNLRLMNDFWKDLRYFNSIKSIIIWSLWGTNLISMNGKSVKKRVSINESRTNKNKSKMTTLQWWSTSTIYTWIPKTKRQNIFENKSEKATTFSNQKILLVKGTQRKDLVPLHLTTFSVRLKAFLERIKRRWLKMLKVQRKRCKWNKRIKREQRI